MAWWFVCTRRLYGAEPSTLAYRLKAPPLSWTRDRSGVESYKA